MEAELVPDEGLRLSFEEHEARLLGELLDEMRMLLEADIPRTDAVRSRLFPDAYDEPEEAEGFRDLVGDDLMAHKREALRTVKERLGNRGAVTTSLPDEEVPAWLALLTDLRLAIGTRLEVTEEDMSAGIDPDRPDAAAFSVLHWLGYVQGSMLEALEEGGTDDLETG